MAEATYTTKELLGVLKSLKRPNKFLSTRYFPLMVTSDREEVAFDEELHDEELAPFVAPMVAGEIMEEQGFDTHFIRPAYIKIKTPFTMPKNLKRAIGESFGTGEMTPAERHAARVSNTIMRHQNRIARRLEWMAAQILVTGGVVIQGPRYPKKVVSYGRDAGLGITLIGTDRWSQGASDPVRDIERWAFQVFRASGAMITEIVMDADAWAAFRENERVLKLLDVRRADGAGPLNIGPQQPVVEGAAYVGSLNQFQIYVYNSGFQVGGVWQPYLPSGTVLGMSAEFAGVRYFGAIMDKKAGIKPYETFMKAWEQEDPSEEILMSQTAPLLAPGRKNAQFACSVL